MRPRARGMNRTSSTGILCNLVLVRKIYAEGVIEELEVRETSSSDAVHRPETTNIVGRMPQIVSRHPDPLRSEFPVAQPTLAVGRNLLPGRNPR